MSIACCESILSEFLLFGIRVAHYVNKSNVQNLILHISSVSVTICEGMLLHIYGGTLTHGKGTIFHSGSNIVSFPFPLPLRIEFSTSKYRTFCTSY